MLEKLKCLAALALLVSFMQAALEVNTSIITNSWGDEYDTYITVKESAPSVLLQHRFHVDVDVNLVSSEPISMTSPEFTSPQLTILSFSYFNQESLFLLHRALLI